MYSRAKDSEYGRRVSFKLLAEIKVRVEAGVEFTKTAQDINRTRQTVSIIAEEFEKPNLKTFATKAEKRTARALSKSGLSEYYISRLLGIKHGELFS